MQRVFEALSSTIRRRMLAYLSETDLTAGEIAARFEITKSAVSQHLNILENAGLVERTKKGQFVHYSLVAESPANPLNGYLQPVCPAPRPRRKESAAIAASRAAGDEEA